MTKNNWIIPTLILTGFLSVAISFYISSEADRQKPSITALGRAELNLGKAYILRKSLTKKEILTRRAQVFKLDSVETSGDGDITLEFDSGYRLRVYENSLITLDNEKDQVILIIKRGELQVENFGREGSLYVSREGQRWEATDYENTYKKLPPPEALPEVVSDQPPSAPTRGSKEGLSSEYIEDVLKSSQSSFFKCYTQILQKTPGVVGEASITFTIQGTGKISNSELTSCTINDAEFKKCLLSAVRRVEFTSFKGEPITTVFPIKFE